MSDSRHRASIRFSHKPALEDILAAIEGAQRAREGDPRGVTVHFDSDGNGGQTLEVEGPEGAVRAVAARLRRLQARWDERAGS